MGYMEKSDVDELLKRYRYNTGRRGHIQAETAKIEREIERVRIDEADLCASVISGMPRSGRLPDSTSEKAALLADDDIPAVKRLQERLAELANELRGVEIDIEFVNAWLGALGIRERFIVVSQVIDGESWRIIAEAYSHQFGVTACETTLRRARTESLNKIYAMAGVSMEDVE